MEIKIMNTKLPAHPFAQIATTDIEQVSGGVPAGNFKFVTFGYDEDGEGPIFTTLALGEEGGHELPAEF
jgi:hypothetical protein